MMKPIAILMFVSASALAGAAFGEIPPKKQKNPGVCATHAHGGTGPAGMAITEEGGDNQHADRPKGKGKSRMKAPTGGASECAAPHAPHKPDGHSHP